LRLNSDGTVGASTWTTNGNVPAESARNLFTYNPTIPLLANRGVSLAWANLSPAQQLALRAPTEVTDVNAQKRLTWLRGGRADEQGQPSGFLRQRVNVFGDIVNADPVYSGAQDFRYDLMPTSVPGQSTYGSFVLAKATRTPTVFIGANDGFTHAINATSGVEMFAYMPSSVFTNAVALTTPGYGTVSNPHQYYVDGPASVGDAYFGGSWHTIFVGSTGGGGKSIFALDVTSPTSFTAANVLFEINVADVPELGNVLGTPLITRLPDGRWAVVFGNGYNNATGQAYLVIVDLANPTSIIKIPAGPSGANGLSGPALYATLGTTTAAFAGDLQGEMWKFDLSSTSPSSWGVAYGTTSSPLPLYVARGPNNEVQPITSAPTLGRNPQRGFALMVYFGTGQFFATGDNIVPSTPPVQSVYGILDGAAISVTNRTVLAPKIMSTQTATTRTVNEGIINWASVSGWYLDLLDYNTTVGKGERSISKPLLLFDRLIFTTVTPSQTTCAAGGTGWLMEVGGVGDNTTTYRMLTSSKYLTDAAYKPDLFLSGNGQGGLYTPTGTTIQFDPTPPPPQRGRLSWRQLQ